MFLGCRDDKIVSLFIVLRSSRIVLIITTFGTFFFLSLFLDGRMCLMRTQRLSPQVGMRGMPCFCLVRPDGFGKEVDCLPFVFVSFSPETVINAFWRDSPVARKKTSKPKFRKKTLGEGSSTVCVQVQVQGQPSRLRSCGCQAVCWCSLFRQNRERERELSIFLLVFVSCRGGEAGIL